MKGPQFREADFPDLAQRAAGDVAGACGTVQRGAGDHLAIGQHDTARAAGPAEKRLVAHQRFPTAAVTDLVGHGDAEVLALVRCESQQAPELRA